MMHHRDPESTEIWSLLQFKSVALNMSVSLSLYLLAVRKLLQHMGGAARRAAPPMCCT